MKKLLNILFLMLLFSSFSPPIFSQTVRIKGENGWFMLWTPGWGVDSLASKDYFSYQGTQVFKNFGETFKQGSTNGLVFNRFKDFPEFLIPDTLILKARVSEWEGNLIGKFVSFNFQDSTNHFVIINIFFDLEYNYKLIKLPIKENFDRRGIEMEKICRIYMGFILNSSDPAPTYVGMVVETDYLSLIYGKTEIILDDFGEISDVPEEKILSSYILEQNYPNPFNPVTKIMFTVPTSQYVNLTVYNLLGQEVATLVNDEKPIGNYEVSFIATNLPSGTYFYRLRAGSSIITKKMQLLK